MGTSGSYRRLRRFVRTRQRLWDRFTASLLIVLAVIVLALVVVTVRTTP